MDNDNDDTAFTYTPFSIEDAKYPFTINEASWESYDSYRPKYPASMWQNWLMYHTSHGGNLETAHDIGAGPGIAAAALSTQFQHVYVSDPGKANIATARRRLTPPHKFTFSQTPGEEKWLPDSSIDFTCICTAIHWMDADKVLQNVAESLRPGGTLAMCQYTFKLKFPQSEELSRLWFEVLKTAFDMFNTRGVLTPALVGGIKNSISGFDGVAVPREHFSNVVRLQINVAESEIDPYAFANPATFPPPPSQITAEEEVRYVVDEEWQYSANVEYLKGLLRSSTLPFDDAIWCIAPWKQLERILADEFGGVVTVEWPASMILATKNKLS